MGNDSGVTVMKVGDLVYEDSEEDPPIGAKLRFESTGNEYWIGPFPAGAWRLLCKELGPAKIVEVPS